MYVLLPGNSSLLLAGAIRKIFSRSFPRFLQDFHCKQTVSLYELPVLHPNGKTGARNVHGGEHTCWQRARGGGVLIH